MKRYKFDLIMILSILGICLIALGIWFSLGKDNGKKAIVYHGDTIVAELDLAKSQRITVDGDISKLTIVVSYGKVYVSESGCENQICVHSGKKSKENETITCLPNKVYVIVIGGEYES